MLLNRLKKSDFDVLRKFKKKVFSSSNFNLKLYYSNFNPSRFAVVVSSKVLKKAVDRNKIKRRVKSVFINNSESLKKGFAVIVYPSKKTINMSFKEMEQELLSLIKKSEIFKNDK